MHQSCAAAFEFDDEVQFTTVFNYLFSGLPYGSVHIFHLSSLSISVEIRRSRFG